MPKLLAASVSLLLGASLQGQTAGTSTFSAGRGNWFDGVNWSTGTFPGPTTEARLDGSVVKLDARGLATPIVFKSLTLVNGAECEIRNARLQADLLDSNSSTLRIYSSHLVVDTFRDPVGGFQLNPSLIEAQSFELVKSDITGSFGLGGTIPASATSLGAGNYARVVCTTAVLDGKLEVPFLYGFVPQLGQQFQIITVNGSAPASGQFVNVPEGGLVTRYNNLGLYLSYVGGDGNDVVLTVQTLPVVTPPLAHATQNGNGFDPLTWSDGQVPSATREHILLARQVSLIGTAPGQSLTVKSLTLRDGADLEVRNLTLHADTIDADSSSLRFYSSHIIVGTFIDPPGFSLNPSLLEAQSFTLVESETIMTLGLGGTTPASAISLGAGNYARVVCNTAVLDGKLEVPFLYGFVPQLGQQFQIITVNGSAPASGQFVNVPEGGLVTRYNNLGLYLSYVGGDGNDVVLTVQPLLTGSPLAHATQNGNGFDPLTWSDGQVPTAASEHILLARQVSLIGTTPGQSLTVKSLTLRDGADLEVRNLTLHADTIDTDNSSLRFYSSHIVVGTFIDPTGFNLNPSLLEAQSFTLVESETIMTLGLGGTTPASATSLGAGNYARVVCNTAVLDGNLEVPFLYGFVPQIGQQFQIITVNTPNGPGSGLSGRFANVREGGVVSTFAGGMLVLSYVGGDGNDVVLTAIPYTGLEIAPSPSGQAMNFSFNTINGFLYTLETTTDLGTVPWTPLPTFLGNGTTHTHPHDMATTPRVFYRLKSE